MKNILQDTIFTAQYDSSAIKFTITWKNGDTILETDNNVSYGVISAIKHNRTWTHVKIDTQYDNTVSVKRCND